MNKSKRQSKSGAASKQQANEPQPMEVDANDDELHLSEDEEGLFQTIFKYNKIA